MACIIFKNFIINRQKDSKYEDYWLKHLDENLKHNMKEAIVATLASQHSLVRNQIANIVAAIASIEIPNKQWGDLLPMLCNNAQHDDFNVKLSSLTTLGYICEELQLCENFKSDDLEQSVKNSIIVALVNNINKGDTESTQEPCRIAIRALVASIPYASANFLVQNEKDFIMDKVFMACYSPNEDIVESALTCLTDITT